MSITGTIPAINRENAKHKHVYYSLQQFMSSENINVIN